MTQLIRKLDTVRAEQANQPHSVDDSGKKRRLRTIESFLHLHEETCARCRQSIRSGPRLIWY